jgi:hypothetical protein
MFMWNAMGAVLGPQPAAEGCVQLRWQRRLSAEGAHQAPRAVGLGRGGRVPAALTADAFKVGIT